LTRIDQIETAPAFIEYEIGGSAHQRHHRSEGRAEPREGEQNDSYTDTYTPSDYTPNDIH
jgi:hypothetical protein